jgi:hypothetical protein
MPNPRTTPENPLEWLMGPQCGEGMIEPKDYDSSGDQAGSEAKLGVGTRSWFRPVILIV